MAAGFYVFFFMARAAESRSGLEMLMYEVADNRADDQRNFQSRRQVNAHAYGQRRQGQGFRIFRQQEVDDDDDDADADT